jgi:uncharacterized membrane protein
MTDPYRAHPGGVLIEEAPDKTMVVVTYALFLAGFLTGGLTTLVGLVMTYALRGDASPIARTHYRFLARTFWLGLVWALVIGAFVAIGVILCITIIGMIVGVPLLILCKIAGVVGLIWYAVRCIAGLMAAIGDRPYGTPDAWLL